MQKKGYHNFPLKIFLSHSAEKIRRESFGVSENFRYRKILWIRGGVSLFSVVLIKLKNVGKGWDSNQYPALQNPVVPLTVP